MRTRLLGTLAIATLALAACGGGDDAGSGSGGSAQDEVADMMIEFLDEQMAAEGISGDVIDSDCIRDAVGELSDSDAEAIVAAGPEGDPEVSAEAEGVGESLFTCVDLAALAEG